MTVRIICGDALQVLPTLAARSVHCCMTSPPYHDLRSYLPAEHPLKSREIGLEPSLEAYVATMVQLFREVRRVLRDNGVVWLNLGDSFAGSGRGGNPTPETSTLEGGQSSQRASMIRRSRKSVIGDGLKPKDLMGIPWTVALALRADGWYLRSEVIWHKLNPQPESVRDRPTRCHEHLFLLTKSPKYYYDADSIMEPTSPHSHARAARGRSKTHKYADGGPGKQTIAIKSPSAGRIPGVNPKATVAGQHGAGSKQNASFSAAIVERLPMRNKRSVWATTSEPFAGDHFATFPPALVEPCILSGCPRGGGSSRSVRRRGHNGACRRQAAARRHPDRAKSSLCGYGRTPHPWRCANV